MPFDCIFNSACTGARDNKVYSHPIFAASPASSLRIGKKSLYIIAFGFTLTRPGRSRESVGYSRMTHFIVVALHASSTVFLSSQSSRNTGSETLPYTCFLAFNSHDLYIPILHAFDAESFAVNEHVLQYPFRREYNRMIFGISKILVRVPSLPAFFPA